MEFVPSEYNQFIDIQCGDTFNIALCGSIIPLTQQIDYLVSYWYCYQPQQFISSDIMQLICKYFGNKIPSKLYSIGKGANGHGQLNGFQPFRKCWKEIEYFRNIHIISIRCAPQHSLFLDINGKVYECGASIKYDACGSKPKLVKYFTENDIFITKVCCDSKHSLALDNEGNVWKWILMIGDTKPYIIEWLRPYKIIDIKAGDGIWYARSMDGEHRLWGNNEYGQCELENNTVSTWSIKYKMINDIFYKKTKCKIKDVYFGQDNVYIIGTK